MLTQDRAGMVDHAVCLIAHKADVQIQGCVEGDPLQLASQCLSRADFDRIKEAATKASPVCCIAWQ